MLKAESDWRPFGYEPPPFIDEKVVDQSFSETLPRLIQFTWMSVEYA